MTSQASTNDWLKRHATALVVLGAVLLLGKALVVDARDLAGGQWGWTLKPQPALLGHPYTPACWLPMLLLIALGAGACQWGSAGGWRLPAAVALLVAVHGGLTLSADLGQGRARWAANVVSATWSEVSNGYFTNAWLCDETPLGFVRHYADVQRHAALKLTTHPPGATLCYWLPLRLYQASPGLQRVSERWLARCLPDPDRFFRTLCHLPTVRPLPESMMGAALFCSLFLALLGSLAVVPVYWLGASGGDRRTGLLAALVFALMPNSLFYYLSLDVVLTTLAALALAGVVHAVREPRAWWAALGAGLALMLAGFISLGALAIGALVLAYPVVAALDGGCDRRTAARVVGLVLGTVAALVVLAWLLGVPVLTIVRQGLGQHQHGLAGTGHRPRLPWLAMNVVDYVLLAGLPVAVLAAQSLGSRSTAGTLARTAAGVMLLLTLSGIVKAETERLWMFFNPALAVAAAAAVGARATRFWTLASQPLALLLMVLSLPPLVRPY